LVNSFIISIFESFKFYEQLTKYLNKMKEELGEIKKEMMFNLITEKDTAELIERIYAKGYQKGVRDQKKLNMRLKFRYNILLEWLDDQFAQFSAYTLRTEYRDRIDGILELKDVFMSENNLHSSYKPSKAFELDIEGESVVFDLKKDLSYLLTDVMGSFITSEDSRLATAKDKKEMSTNQNPKA
jgi:hypothetical protein